jgi:hypothetical protein
VRYHLLFLQASSLLLLLLPGQVAAWLQHAAAARAPY